MRAFLLPISLFAGLTVGVVPALAVDQTVTARGSNVFIPATVTVQQGEKVTWSNVSGVHNVSFDDGSFTQPPIPSSSGWTVSRTFDTAGEFRYFCEVHGAPGGGGMAGVVTVNPRASTEPGTAPPASTGGGGPAAGEDVTVNGPVAPLAKPKCASRRKFQIRLRHPDGIRFRSARVSVNGKPVKVVKRTIRGRLRYTALVDLRGLPRGTYATRIAAVTASGRAVRGTRTYRTCARKRTPRTLPRL
jgi:plastocyanin